MGTLLRILVLLGWMPVCLAADVLRQTQTEDIYEVVFRFQIEHASTSQKENSDVYFLAVANSERRDGFLPLPLGEKRHDPSDELMVRFKRIEPPVLKNSALQSRSRESRRGLRFRVTAVRWKAESWVEVDGGHDDFWGASWSTFTVTKENGKWGVTKTKLNGAIIE